MKLSEYIKPEVEVSSYADKFGISKERMKELHQKVYEAEKTEVQKLRDELDDSKNEMFFGNPMVHAAFCMANVEVETVNELLYVFSKAQEVLLGYHNKCLK